MSDSSSDIPKADVGDLPTTERREIRAIITRTAKEYQARLRHVIDGEQQEARVSLWERPEVQALAKLLENDVNSIVADFARKAESAGFRLEPRDGSDFEMGFRLVATQATFRKIDAAIARKYRLKQRALDAIGLNFEAQLVPSLAGQDLVKALRQQLERVLAEPEE